MVADTLLQNIDTRLILIETMDYKESIICQGMDKNVLPTNYEYKNVFMSTDKFLLYLYSL